MKSVSERKTIDITQETIKSLEYALLLIEEQKENITRTLSYIKSVNKEAASFHSFSQAEKDFLYVAHDSAKAFSRTANFGDLNEIYFEFDKLNDEGHKD